MDSVALALVLISAASHAAWNYAAKNAGDKDSFLLLMNLTSQVTILPVFLLTLKEWGLPMIVLPMIILSAIAEAVYFLSLSRAYEQGDLSVVYPVVRSSPLFVAAAGALFLGEWITLVGIIGIVFILLGVYVLHIKKLERRRILEPLRSFRGPAFRFAILAALGTTIYSLSDKVGVSTIDPFLYAFWLEIFISAILIPIVIFRRGWRAISFEWDKSKRNISISGVLMRGGYLLMLLAMVVAPVGYLLALRQVSVVIGALIGVVLLGEGYGAPRLLGSVSIFIGIYMIAVFA